MHEITMPSRHVGATILVLVLALPGCTAPPTQQQTGSVIGGVLGGVLGSHVGGGHGRTAATIVGSIVGSSVGGAVGRSMDQQDRLMLSHSLENARTGTTSHWRNPDTGVDYTVKPTRTFEAGSTPCREYVVDGTIGGKQEQVIGTACRQADGSWRAAS